MVRKLMYLSRFFYIFRHQDRFKKNLMMEDSPVFVDYTASDRPSVTILDGLFHPVYLDPCVARGVMHDRHRGVPGCGIGHGSLPQEGQSTAFLPGAIVPSQRTPLDSTVRPRMGLDFNDTGTCRPFEPSATLFKIAVNEVKSMGQFEDPERVVPGKSRISRGKGTVVRNGRDVAARRGK